MTTIDSDVSYALVKEAMVLYGNSDIDVILNLASTCRVIREACLAALFADVHWPHGNKHDEESGLLFFPPSLWPFFKRFELIWPEEWPDATPPRWGDRYYIGGDYHPRHIDKLVTALPAMPSLSSFYLSCPFYPPNSILNALIQCPSLRDLSMHDTPLYISMIPKVPANFHLERLAIVPVAEAVRVGEGPFDARYTERTYYVREYRRKYKNDSLARYAATAFLFQVGKAAHLRHVQLSADLCTLDSLTAHEWPVLDTLVLTGHAPRGNTELIDVIAKMPRLRELRLLFAKTKTDPGFRLLLDHLPTVKNNYPSVLGQLERLALSNACNFDDVFHYTTSLQRLAICAIIDQPRVPIALSRADIDRVLDDMAIGQRMGENKLVRLRLMIEDKVNPGLCHAIAIHCPNLEALEIELCGYHDGKSIHAWEEFSDAFASLRRLRELRICIQFPEFDEMDTYEPWRAARRECALFLAGRLTYLQRVGFEYRKRTGTHRFEDSWLEFSVERKCRAGVPGAVELHELGASWYPFPEVWIPVPAGKNTL
ncbi:hypothetical protein D9615_005574 [Tricholomella constricta]|uniref:F-box domain-containing protein n=1 Tax=Tricholomella constricta TaxID=117010 RepID=A0A8H5M5R8_9AGAR|nr:hypothetical protein D9615_005574 [Tricholomella constricta]